MTLSLVEFIQRPLRVLHILPSGLGHSVRWVLMTYDLSACAGKNILVAFRHITNWATSYFVRWPRVTKDGGCSPWRRLPDVDLAASEYN
jgi:hypothetical protein